MADPDLITGYVTALRGALGWHPDVDDLACEVDDHLRCAALLLEARGLDPASAQREVLERFGETTLVAHAFSLTPSGGTAMPTRLTRAAGMFAVIAAVAWIAVAPAAIIGAGSEDWEAHYATLAILSFLASACSTIALYGLMRRAGSGGAMTSVTLTLAILGTLTLGIVTWAWLVGVSLLAIAAVMVVLALHSARLGTTIGNALLVAAWPVGVATAVVLDVLQVGPIDAYGEPYLGQLIGYSVGGLLFAAGLFASGWWLRREAVVDVSDSVATA
jgi:hypothetical protein